MSEDMKNASINVHNLIAQRWSPRAFDAEKSVEQEKLLSVLEAARWAPSCFGDEPWRFVVTNRFEDEQAWQQMLSLLAPKNQQWAQHAPVLMLACADSVFRANGKPNRWAEYDTGQASISLCLQATALGLVTHQMGGFDADKARDVLKIPEQFTAMAAIALGYQGDIGRLDEGFQSIEVAARERQPMSKNFFLGAWDKSITME
ncbi:MAG: nitroreductase family protein [Mariprofundaceae bacterium]